LFAAGKVKLVPNPTKKESKAGMVIVLCMRSERRPSEVRTPSKRWPSAGRIFPPIPPCVRPAIGRALEGALITGEPPGEHGTYCIERRRLWEDEDVYGWVRHMAGRDWVNLDDFAEALRVARRFASTPNGITRSQRG
jgi:hypothetical protein